MFLLLFLSSFASAERELKFVQAIWRHGDRAPTSLPYPNDPYTEEYWPRGWGELTSEGMQQHHMLGQWFRQRYDGFINATYIPAQAYMRSSDTDRALTSAQAFLSGMYPATSNYQWSTGNSWQPIPVHSATAGENDWLCKCTSVDCPNYDVIYNVDEQHDSDTFSTMYSDMFKMLAQENTTGNTNFSYSDVNGIYDITREMIHNMTELQPDWVFQTWPQYNGRTTLDIGSELRWIRYINQWGTVQKGQFFAGYLVNDFITHAQNVAAGKQKNPEKMLWYSSHDTVISSLMYAMSLGDGQMPPYAACFFMEVWKQNGTYVTEFYYRNTTDEPHRLAIPGCDQPCPVSKLADVYKGVAIPTPDAALKNCGVTVPSQCSQNRPNTSRTSSYLSSTLLPLFLVIFYQ